MITKFEKYHLIFEKSDLSILNVPHKLIKYLYNTLSYTNKLLHNCHYELIDLENFKTFINEEYSALFLIKSINTWDVIIKNDSYYNSNIIQYDIKTQEISSFNFTDLQHYYKSIKNKSDKIKIYCLEYTKINKSIDIYKIIFNKFEELYSNLFEKIRKTYEELCIDEKNRIEYNVYNNDEYRKYYMALECDIDFLEINHFKKIYNVFLEENIDNYIRNHIDYNNFKKNYNNDYYMIKNLKFIAYRLFNNINTQLNFISYKYFDIYIQKNPLLFKRLRNSIFNPEILNKYKYLEDSEKFDLI